jgi:hypothetical protein
MTANGISFGPDLLLKYQTVSQVLIKNWHGLTPMAHQEPAAHLNITYQTHMVDIYCSKLRQFIQCNLTNKYPLCSLGGKTKTCADLETALHCLLRFWACGQFFFLMTKGENLHPLFKHEPK